MKKISVSVWLIPEEYQRKLLQETINTLSNRYGAFSFIPHITIYHLETSDVGSVIAATEMIAKNTKVLSLNLNKISYSNVFTKTLFAQYEINPDLKRLNIEFKKVFSDFPQYEINPHLSLIYKNNMSDNDKLEEIQKIKVPHKLVLDSLMIITRNSSIAQDKDVMDWKSICKLHLVE